MVTLFVVILHAGVYDADSLDFLVSDHMCGDVARHGLDQSRHYIPPRSVLLLLCVITRESDPVLKSTRSGALAAIVAAVKVVAFSELPKMMHAYLSRHHPNNLSSRQTNNNTPQTSFVALNPIFPSSFNPHLFKSCVPKSLLHRLTSQLFLPALTPFNPSSSQSK